jgi:hypothetical protein
VGSDFLARLADGTGVVIDVRADDRIEPRDAEAFEITAPGVRFGGLPVPPGRRDRSGADGERAVAVTLSASAVRGDARGHRRAAADVCPADGPAGWAASAGDSLAVLPVLFHLMWRRVLESDLSSGPLNSASLVWLAAGAR